MATAKTPKSASAAKAADTKSAATLPAVNGAGAAAVNTAEIETVIVEPVAAEVAALAEPVPHPVKVAAADPAAIETAAVVAAEPVAAPKVEASPAPAALIDFPVIAPVLNQVVEPALKSVDELLDFSKANAEAVIAASHSMAVGLQSLVQDLITWSQHSLENSVATGKALSEAGSVQDALELTQQAAQQSLEKILNEGTRIGSLSTKLVEESFAPLRARVEAVVEKLTSRAA